MSTRQENFEPLPLDLNEPENKMSFLKTHSTKSPLTPYLGCVGSPFITKAQALVSPRSESKWLVGNFLAVCTHRRYLTSHLQHSDDNNYHCKVAGEIENDVSHAPGTR